MQKHNPLSRNTPSKDYRRLRFLSFLLIQKVQYDAIGSFQ